MGKERRKRSKDEGTFLESVKSLLGHLQEEVKHIRTAVDKLQIDHSLACFPNYMYSYPDCWPHWNSEESWSSLVCTLPTEPSTLPSNLSAAAPCFTPGQETVVLDQKALLSLRTCYGDMGIPKELANMSCKVARSDDVDDDEVVTNLPRLWRRRRPSAKVRRRRKTLALENVLSASQVIANVPELSDHSSFDGGCGDSQVSTSQIVPEPHGIVGIEKKNLTDDAHEMILPISGGTWLSHSQQSYPLKLQRKEFFASLPANADLLLDLEAGLERGSAYRTDWAEQSVGPSAHKQWNKEEIEVWIRVTMRLAGKEYGRIREATSDLRLAEDARLSILKLRWMEALSSLPESLHAELWQVLATPLPT